jgi:TonB family protein
MKNNILHSLSIAALIALSASVVSADIFTLSSGTAYNGKIFKILEGQVTIDVAGGEKTTAPLVDFDGASQEVINKWASSHPESVDVYTKWDSQPVIKSSAISQLPNQFRDPAFKGMVSVDLVLNEKGQVISAKVQKSTHAELEAPSVKAAKAWRFEPAKVAGKSVKSKLRVPFKFSYDGKAG